ncbi:cysteine-rich receptor-like protein kinase [Trifolium medium]|uniref:Cysteine-rich receptor-like protein kinase n=1 Tax=Trifolium medium TaxID=97028 RepID=A0A392MGP0_9FABA|nr:cysteine-rich receptor-like protein kinase [Trifolium medium]
MDNRPTLDGIEFQGVDPVEVTALTTPFTATEIEEVVMSSDGIMSPGPDGFNFSFFQRFWGLLKVELGICLINFSPRPIFRRAFPRTLLPSYL